MKFLVIIACLLTPFTALAQASDIAFGQANYDAALPVEITSDELSIDQQAGTAVFSGNVVAGQGQMRLSAGRVEVTYSADNSQIETLVAKDGVMLVNGAEQAEAREAVYAVASSEIIMSGDVLLTQGPNALSGEKLTVDLRTGSGRIEGRVKTVFQTGGNE